MCAEPFEEEKFYGPIAPLAEGWVRGTSPPYLGWFLSGLDVIVTTPPTQLLNYGLSVPFTEGGCCPHEGNGYRLGESFPRAGPACSSLLAREDNVKIPHFTYCTSTSE